MEISGQLAVCGAPASLLRGPHSFGSRQRELPDRKWQAHSFPNCACVLLGAAAIHARYRECQRRDVSRRSFDDGFQKRSHHMPEDVTFFGERPKVRYLWQVPQAASPEILLAGRSNAGKSTLLNAVLDAAGKKKSAGTSQKGGRTRTLNWYPVGFSMPLGWEGDGTRIIREEHESLSLEDELKAAGEGCCIVDPRIPSSQDPKF